MFSMNETTVPRGVKFSFLMLSFPLVASTFGKVIIQFVLGTFVTMLTPDNAYLFGKLARTSLRILALNISFLVRKHGLIRNTGWNSLWVCSSKL
jgi:hypothetical protein